MSSEMSKSIQEALETLPFLIIDGALATELEARGCDLNDPLWSAKILLEQPDSTQEVHRSYFEAGADIAITASYQASYSGLQERGLGDVEARNLIQRSVQLADNARYEILESNPDRRMFIAGSVGPYGAYLADGSEYRGDYEISTTEMKEFHRHRIEALLAAGVDILAFETLPSAYEAEVLLELLQEYPSARAWFSFTLRDATHISDGTGFDAVVTNLDASEQIIAIGVNCVPPDHVTPALVELAKLTAKPLLAYPNSGELWDANTNTWSGDARTQSNFPSLVKEWRLHGAKLIGGCCRTTPETTRSVYLERRKMRRT